MEISYKIYENLRSIEKILRKYVRNVGLIFVQIGETFNLLKYLYKSFASITRRNLYRFLQGYLEKF